VSLRTFTGYLFKNLRIPEINISVVSTMAGHRIFALMSSDRNTP
jgi:hypothetical protein